MSNSTARHVVDLQAGIERAARAVADARYEQDHCERQFLQSVRAHATREADVLTAQAELAAYQLTLCPGCQCNPEDHGSLEAAEDGSYKAAINHCYDCGECPDTETLDA